MAIQCLSSCAYLSFAYLLWWSIYSNIYLFVNRDFCFWDVGVLYIFCILIPYQINVLQVLSLILWAVYFDTMLDMSVLIFNHPKLWGCSGWSRSPLYFVDFVRALYLGRFISLMLGYKLLTFIEWTVVNHLLLDSPMTFSALLVIS